jgi:tetratricopeptide (TPR) repeat protein
METHPPEHLLVHPLPAAPDFVGREAELHELRRAWQDGFRGVLALVGLGGAGKTAVAARFLQELTAAAARPRGLFLWSFYQEPDAGLFLQRAYHYFGGPAAVAQPARGAGLLHLLREALARGGPHWLVLDGLERVQRQQSAGSPAFGQVEDPLLKGLLTRAAEGMGQTVVLVTSRFPLTDLQPLVGRGYRPLEVAGLSPPAARALLRRRGVKGDDLVLDGLVERYGAHALTLDHLGGILGQFLNGDPGRAPEVADWADPGKDRQAFRLARLLRAYEEHLPAAELALLCRLCLLRRSVTEDHLFQFFLCSPPVHIRTARLAADLFRDCLGLEKWFDEDAILDLAKSVRETLEEALSAGPIAGPEAAFRAEVAALADRILQLPETARETTFGELARLYGDPALEHPTDLLPLGRADRAALRSLFARHAELSEHPLMPFGRPPAALEQAFQTLGFGKCKRPPAEADLSPADVWHGSQWAKKRLLYLAAKHFALRRLRELCRLHRSKWSLAGPLAELDVGGLRQVMGALADRHLVQREADESYSVHPAVRDHFHRLATALDQGAWHDVLREKLVSLVRRPGQRHPDDPAALDLVEEAIYHAQEAGRADEALWLYERVLGGLRHLAWKLGESARGLRVLRGFRPCPDRWALGWYLRALGEFEQAFDCNELPYFRADIRLLQGRLPEVAALGDSTRTALVDFLMGKTTSLPPTQLGSAVPRAQLLLYLGRLEGVRRGGLLDGFYHDIGWEGDHARCQLLLAEAARRQNNEALCRRYLDSASAWILHAGSVEHLCLLHLVRSRFARAVGDVEGARRAVVEGLHVARQCGLGLYWVELLCELAEVLLASGDVREAEQAARQGLQQATDVACQFQWGAGQAGHLVGQTLLVQERFREAREVLKRTLSLRRRLGDPGAAATEALL